MWVLQAKLGKLAALDLLSFAYRSAIVHYRSPIVCNRLLSFAIVRLSFAIVRLSFAIVHLSFAIIHLSFTYRSPIVRQSLSFTKFPAFVPLQFVRVPVSAIFAIRFSTTPQNLDFLKKKNAQKPTDTTPIATQPNETWFAHTFSDQPVRQLL